MTDPPSKPSCFCWHLRTCAVFLTSYQMGHGSFHLSLQRQCQLQSSLRLSSLPRLQKALLFLINIYKETSEITNTSQIAVLFLLIYFCVYGCSTPRACGALGNQKRMSDHLAVESQVAVRGHVSKGN